MLEPVLLLTATISPGQTTHTARADPQARLRDYQLALTHWLTHGPCRHVVLCESSAAAASCFAEQFILAKRLGRVLEFHSFQQDFSPALGKGFGELGIIERALAANPHLAQAPMILNLQNAVGRCRIDVNKCHVIRSASFATSPIW
jgi:hypothetical protein